ncbi:ABC transporter substrate-binding protein [Actinotignum schaalii]|uniref:ABC transporter substrate-binding protein n=1 Tax=Actinotignum schaalii TaxID=59505 RepID=UPI0003FA5A68|nr:ABC transporter substrate-binding protein [Actinotignum schaalii]AIE82859.1 ABC transporter substrate-binding protein [Actinotignum schaalii]WQN44983.1 ABC transporter substrate-binding protein [Actinotignum schaalii]
MHSVKKIAALAAAGLVAIAGLGGCVSNSDSGGGSEGGAGKVYFLNYKPESDQAFQELAKKYHEQTGVDIKIVSATGGSYEPTLANELGRADGPTIFRVDGPIGLAKWKQYASDISDAPFIEAMTDKDMALKGDDGKIYGVPHAVEGFGIIYNDAILQKYFALPGAKAKSVDEIKNFDKLKEVADDMQAKKDELGIKGAFAVTSLSPNEDWRWQTHLMNWPLFYELRDKGVQDTGSIEGTYLDNMKKIFDLYLTDSTVDPSQTTAKAVTDSMAEFALGQVAFVQNGNWAWSQIDGVDGNTVKSEDIHFLPIYMGVKGEEKAGISVGTEAYLTINNKASDADKKASMDFLNWMLNDPTGAKLCAEDLGFIAPFKEYASLSPTDPLGKEVIKYMKDTEHYNVAWDFQVAPSMDFKNGLGQHLSQYAVGKESWDQVKDYFVTQWNTEKAAAGVK